MTLPTFARSLFGCLLLAASPVFAAKEEDAPLPYDDNTTTDDDRALPKKSHRSERLREEDEEAQEREESKASYDDPNIGLSAEFLAGLMLFEAARGSGVDPRFMWGLRATWEWGRLFPDEFLREMFFADLTWQYAATHDGTAQVYADANQHYVMLSPAVALPLGKSWLAAYGQLGIGFDVDSSVVHIDKVATQLTGTKFAFQYGVGLRGRPAILADGSLRISFRVELTRLVRGYMQDTFLGGSVGVTF